MCGESDVSIDFLMGGRGSVDSGARAYNSASECGAQVDYFHKKSLDTLQILQNKEETLQVQSESLRVAESRIESLTTKNSQLQRQLHDTTEELFSIRNKQKCNCRNGMTSTEYQLNQDTETQKEFVKYLQDHISVIEDLYRECFYETAKQEDVIETLRRSHVDVRIMERNKSDEINRLNNIVNSQQISINKCQNIVGEVHNLRSEIWNFLNNSNNDSGVWERSEEGVAVANEIGDDIQEITLQLHQLRDILHDDYLREENDLILKQRNELLQKQVDELTNKAETLENNIREKETLLVQHEEHIRTINEENLKYHKELCLKDDELSLLHSQLRDFATREQSLVNQLASVHQHCAQLEDSYREKVSSAAYLHRELIAATEGGAEICAESRRVLAVLRLWVAHIRQRDKEQAQTIKEQDRIIKYMRRKRIDTETDEPTRQPREMRHETKPGRVNETEACCSGSCRNKSRGRRSEEAVEKERETGRRTGKHSSTSERDWRRKQRIARCQLEECAWRGQRGHTSSSVTPEPPIFCRDINIPTREMSLSAELEERMLNMQEALTSRRKCTNKRLHNLL